MSFLRFHPIVHDTHANNIFPCTRLYKYFVGISKYSLCSKIRRLTFAQDVMNYCTLNRCPVSRPLIILSLFLFCWFSCWFRVFFRFLIDTWSCSVTMLLALPELVQGVYDSYTNGDRLWYLSSTFISFFVSGDFWVPRTSYAVNLFLFEVLGIPRKTFFR